MTIHIVDVHDRTHTCPADPTPHPIDSTRRLVDTVPGGPCRQPITGTAVPCGRRRPADQQCDACRTTVTVRHHTRDHLGPAPRTTVRPSTALAARPCEVCGLPLAAVLAHVGRHLLCRPTTETGAVA
ncbi:hypothetical protein EV385_2600 [Krasilnikovia cinnamomea]|uniref:Uncharacterized protein n=1 Tax=Krasilnikovia cinnamomea TaxID=349313 RepID=A0A4Q7ZJW9_9ACTN|nr:hypothetical protein EV385_2600 [Krasilnikovia cinnamomea]